MALTLAGLGTVPVAPDEHLVPRFGQKVISPKRSNKGEETYYPVGHFHLLDLRRHTLRHLALGDQVNRRKEHDMRAIKRSGAAGIREGIPLGKKTISARMR